MPTVKVTVLRDGKPVSGNRVVIEISGLGGGMSNAEYTDSSGVAEFDVEDGQEGKVYVDGSNYEHWGSYSANDITVNL
ncbi:MAG: hypothetical protein KKA19_01970 [Candidatus Margulisbacteria bacterium]|nr:hypothetical protein [Candidatus Margulisiibacteriota bacterium]